MNRIDRQAATPTIENNPPLALPDYLRQARQNQPGESAARLHPPAFLKRLKTPFRLASKSTTSQLAPNRLPSGLTIETTLEIVSGLEAALTAFKPGTAPYPALTPSEIQIEDYSSGLLVKLRGREGETELESDRQCAITSLFYWLTTGQELNLLNPQAQFKQLAQDYPHTVKVLRLGWQAGYSSTRQLSGAFGWSFFRREHLPLTDAQIAAANLVIKPDKALAARQMELPQPSEDKPSARGQFPALLAFSSLGLGLVLIVAFLVFSMVNPPETARNSLVKPSASPQPSPTVPPGLVNTRQSDGASLTRFNPAYLTQAEQPYRDPATLAPGQATLLSGQRPLRVLNAQWSLGQNIYLTLQDGGWEAWDTASGTRISRRELPDADQYAWVVWSPDGENFAAQGFDGKMRLGTGGRVLRTFAYKAEYSLNQGSLPVSWSPNSNFLLLRLAEGLYQFWNFQGGPQPIMPQPGKAYLDLSHEENYQNSPGSWSWSGDSRYIAFFMGSASNTVVIYDSRSLAKVASLSLDWQSQLQTGQAFSDQYNGDYYASQGNFAWSPDGHYMALQRWIYNSDAASGNNTPTQRILTIWEVPPGLLTRGNSTTLIPNLYQVIKLANPDSASLLEWSRTDRLLLNSRQRGPEINSPVVTRNNLLVFEVDQGVDFNWINTYTLDIPGQPEQVSGWWSLDGQRILVNSDLSYLAIYQVPSEWPLPAVQALKTQALSDSNSLEALDRAIPSPDGRFLATFSRQTGPELRDLKTGQLKTALTGPGYDGPGPLPMLWSPDSQFLAVVYTSLEGSAYNSRYTTVAHLWKFDKGQGLPEFYGDVLIAGQSSFVPVVAWNPNSDGPELWFEKNLDRVNVWKFTGQPLLSLDEQKQAELNNQAVGMLQGRSVNPVMAAAAKAWFPDWRSWIGPLDNTRDYGIIELQTVSGNAPLKITHLTPNTGEKPADVKVSATAVSPDSRMLGLGFSNGLVQLYDAASGKLFQAFTAHQAPVTGLSFTPDGKSLATASDDRTVKIWDTTGWKLTALLRGQSQPVTFIQWFPDGKSLLVGGSSLVIWRVS